MKRVFIALDKLIIYDQMHVFQPDGSFVVDEEKDGQDTYEHITGIEYVKSVISNGAKTLPILVLDNEDGTFTRLDGFKRSLAYQQLGFKFIEAFVCTQEEYRRSEVYPFGDYEMRCFHGGQDGEKGKLPLLEAHEHTYQDIDPTVHLFKGEDLKIEVADTIHLHWGQYGKYRIEMGRRDFVALAEAISKI